MQVSQLFPKNCFHLEADYKPLLKAMEDICEAQDSESHEESDDSDALLLDDKFKEDLPSVLAQFLFVMGRFVNQANSDFIVELTILMNMVRWAHEDLSASYGADKEDASEAEKISLATRLANALVCEKYPSYLKKVHRKGMKYLGKKAQHVFNVIMMVKIWADWMVLNGISNTKIEINTEK